MSALIARVRTLIFDPAGASQTWSDDDIQTQLDLHRDEVRYLQLTPVPTIQSNGQYTWLEYLAPARYQVWESDVVLQNGTWQTLTPATSELLIGRWTFAETQGLVVYASGQTYDLYAAAADLLEMRIVQLWETTFDVKTDGQDMSRSQKIDTLQKAIRNYRKKAYATRGKLTRSDVVPDNKGHSVEPLGWNDYRFKI